MRNLNEIKEMFADGKVIIVLDTETIGLENPQVYDLGYVIYNTADGKVLKMRDYITKQVYDNLNLFNSAYYANKRPIYEDRLADGYCKKCYWGVIVNILKKDIERYGVDGIFAYNSRFDTNAIRYTCETLNAKQNPVADGIIDIWKGITDPHITETEDYIKFCVDNGFMTKHKKPRPQAKAETLFRYLTQDTKYQEQHTALEDSKIELQILLHALGLSA